MKKNIAMRVAAFLFILTMISTFAFTTTFAKYTTSGEAKDSARVAKWGVVVEGQSPDYVVADENGSGQDAEIIVGTNENVIAPGSETKFATVVISGTPEVAVDVTYTGKLVLKDWKVSDSEEYCPLIFVVGTTEYYIGKDGINDIAGLISSVETAIAGYTESYEANKNLSSAEVLEVYCVWQHVQDTVPGQRDANDTILGNASKAPTISLEITCTVTQRD